MGTHPIFESDFDCLTESKLKKWLTKQRNNTTLACSRKTMSLKSFRPRTGKQWATKTKATKSGRKTGKTIISRRIASSVGGSSTDCRSKTAPTYSDRSSTDPKRRIAFSSSTFRRIRASSVSVTDIPTPKPESATTTSTIRHRRHKFRCEWREEQKTRKRKSAKTSTTISPSCQSISSTRKSTERCESTLTKTPTRSSNSPSPKSSIRCPPTLPTTKKNDPICSIYLCKF